MTKEEKSKYNILILEDELITQQDIKEKVESLGYNVSGVADSYEEAMDAADEVFPDVALCDIKIVGHRDGTEVARALKKKGNLAIVYLTVYSDPEIRERAMKANPAGYLLKGLLNEGILDIHLQIALKNLKRGTKDESKINEGKLFAWDRGIYHIINIQDILYVEANNNGCFIFTNEEKYDINQKFGTIAEKLTEHNIKRVSRSHAIPVNNIKAFDKGLTFVELDYKNVNDKIKKHVKRTITVTKAHRENLKADIGI